MWCFSPVIVISVLIMFSQWNYNKSKDWLFLSNFHTGLPRIHGILFSSNIVSVKMNFSRSGMLVSRSPLLSPWFWTAHFHGLNMSSFVRHFFRMLFYVLFVIFPFFPQPSTICVLCCVLYLYVYHTSIFAARISS